MKFIFLEKFGGRLNSKVCYDTTIRLPIYYITTLQFASSHMGEGQSQFIL